MVSINFQTLSDDAKEDINRPLLSAIHSGNAGDILYSLPSIRALGVRHVILNVFRSFDPLRKLTREAADALVPLLMAQDYIDRVTVVQAGVPLEGIDSTCINVDYVLDRFRHHDIDRNHLMYAHARAMGVDIDPNIPFLSVSPCAEEPGVVICLTPRYRGLSEEFIRDVARYFEHITLVAIPEEWQTISGLAGEVRKCKDFLEMARLIQSARLFIGNPSLASAIAEGLKVPRIIDLPLSLANAFPIGPRGYVMPARRDEFIDIVRHLCPEKSLQASYVDLRELVERLKGENQQLRDSISNAASLVPSVIPSSTGLEPDDISLVSSGGSALFTGGIESRIDRENRGIFLHPGPPGMHETTVRFASVELLGHNCFSADLAVDHVRCEPVRFWFRLWDQTGTLLIESSMTVPAATVSHWKVPFQKVFGVTVVELATTMAEGAGSADYAWAWFKNPMLVARQD